jgi:hypothetical protein
VATNETTLTSLAGVAVNDPTIFKGDVLEVVVAVPKHSGIIST